MKDLFFFNAMLTPKIITIVYWVLLVGVLIGSLFTMYGGSFLAGLGSLIGGAIGTRMFCEMMIVLFKIHENLQKIANRK